MRIKFILFICMMVSTSLLHAQRHKAEGRYAVTLSPALLPLPYGGQLGIQPGVEYHFSPRLAILSEFTFQLTGTKNADSAFMNTRYFRIKHELRYHLAGKQNHLQPYIGLQGSYTFRSFRNGKAGFYHDNLPDEQVYFFDKANINSPITTFSLQCGAILSDTKRFSADVFVGLGARFVNTRFREVDNLRIGPPMEPTEFFSNPASYQRKGRQVEPLLNAGIRFMYHFGPAR